MPTDATEARCPSCGTTLDSEDPPESVYFSWTTEDSEGREFDMKFSGWRCPECRTLLSNR